MGLAELALVRDAVNAGEWWRLWSAHLVHTDSQHLGWNLGLLLVLGTVAHRAKMVRATLIYLLFSMPLISLGLLVLYPELQWYAGLSGVLHGLIALILLARFHPAAWLGLGLLATKLTLEQANLWPAPTTGYSVVSEAHVLGFLCGMTGGLIHRVSQANRFPETTPPPRCTGRGFPCAGSRGLR